MKQIDIINTIKTVFPKIEGIEIALLYGSFARKEGNPNSDIDIQLIVNQYFDKEALKMQITEVFHKEIQYITEVILRNKLVFISRIALN